MKKKMLTLLLALVMMVSVIPGASAAGTQPQDDSSTIFRDPNRYYYVTEYTDHFQSGIFIITPEEAEVKDWVKGKIAEGMGNIISGDLLGLSENSQDFRNILGSCVENFFAYVYSKEPYARHGIYFVSLRYKIKYKVDYLDPTNKVPVDKWLVSDIVLKRENQNGIPYTVDEYSHTVHLK